MCPHCGATLDPGALVCVECHRTLVSTASAAAPAPDAPVAHAEPCPKHPAFPTAGACPRCGSFVCIRCAPGAASGQLTCADCLARAQQQHALTPSPFGGPLVFPLLGLVLKTLFFVLVLVAAVATGGWRTGLMVGASLALTVPAFVGFLLRKRWVPWLLVGLYALDGVTVVLAGQVTTYALLAWSVAWAPYFLLSKRVKATFTR